MRRYLKDDGGGVTVMFAAATPVLLLCAALSVDIGTFYLQKRALQGATDLAAVAAARNSATALIAAQQNLADNGFSSSAVQNVTFGVYTADPTLSPAARFVPSANGNAVQVQTQIQAPYYFATILNLLSSSTTTDSARITATATAALDPQAAFAIGSGLVNLNGGIENAVLGALLGGNVSLSAMDYQSLASANVNLFTFSNALATRAGLTGVTYNQLAATQVTAPEALGALADAAEATPGVSVGTVDALTALAGVAPNSSIAIGSLVSYGEYGSLTVNSASPIDASADAMDLVSAIAGLANGSHEVQVALNVNTPPIASATLDLTVGEPPVGSGFVSIGSTGATVHTAQTRLLLTLQLTEAGSSSLITLPLYVEIASGTATLASTSCPADPTQDTATLAVTPGVVSAWIGSVSSADMTDYSSQPSPGPATLVTIPGLATISGAAEASIANLAATDQTYSTSDIANDVRKTTSTTDYIASLLNSLFSGLQLSAQVGPLNVTVPPAAGATIGATLAAATTPIDQTLTQILQAVGVSLGNAYTWVSALNCSSAKLVL